MSMFHWEPDMVRFMKDASERTDYWWRLAGVVAEEVRGPGGTRSMTVCDAGCGLGYLSAELAKRFARVTAVDLAEPAVEALREMIARRGIANLTAVRGDASELGNARFDVMVFCLFGDAEASVRIAENRCGTAVLCMRGAQGHRFADEPDRERFLEKIARREAFLRSLGVPVNRRELALRLDQPFRSLADAERFFDLYGGRRRYAESADRLIRTGDGEFPFLLPVRKELMIYTLTFDH